MNIFKLHNKPQELLNYDLYKSNPNIAWKLLVTTEVTDAWEYDELDPKIENEIMNNSALWATSAETAYNFADRFIMGRWKPGEKAISADASYSFYYSRDVLNARFIDGEEAIKTDEKLWNKYLKIYQLK